MHEECISPKGSGLHNHRQDQSAFSIFINLYNFTCQTNTKFWGNPGNLNAQTKKDVILYSRKGLKQIYPEIMKINAAALKKKKEN